MSLAAKSAARSLMLVCLTVALMGVPLGWGVAQTTAPQTSAPVPGQGGATPSTTDPGSAVASIAGDGALSQGVQADPHPIWGIAGHFDVNLTAGAGTYSVPIDVPPGIAGIKPSLSLNYNSSTNSNGPLGVGWGIGGTASIVRCPSTRVTNAYIGGVNDDVNDRFCLDGQQLIAVSGTYGAEGTRYAKEKDDFSRIISHGCTVNQNETNFNGELTCRSPAWWEVDTKDGKRLYFGNVTTSSGSQLAEPAPAPLTGTVVEAWELDQVSDLNGNTITYDYIDDTANGAVYPSVITYGSNSPIPYGSNSPPPPPTTPTTPASVSIGLIWQQRVNSTNATLLWGDTPIAYTAGYAHQTLYRLKSIQTAVGTGSGCSFGTGSTPDSVSWGGGTSSGCTLVADYELGYYDATSPIPTPTSTGRSVLVSVTKYDGQKVNYMPTLSFTAVDAQIDTPPDTITSFSNGLGATTSVTYLPALSPTVARLGSGSSYPIVGAAPPPSVVYQVQTSSQLVSVGISASPQFTGAAYTTQYFYQVPESDVSGRGYLGFSTSAAMDQQTGLTFNRVYSHAFPMIGESVFVRKQITANSQCVDCITNQLITSPSAQVPAQTFSAAPVFGYIAQSDEMRQDIMPAMSGTCVGYACPVPTSAPALPTLTKTFVEDAWGRETSQTITSCDGSLTTCGTAGPSSYAHSITETYAAVDTGNWLVARLLSVSDMAQGPLVNGTMPASITRGAVYAYSSIKPWQVLSKLAYVGNSQPNNGGCIPTASTDNMSSLTCYGYDNFGNVNSVQTNNGDVTNDRLTSITYDSTGRFPITVSKKASATVTQTESRLYDPGLGVLLSASLVQVAPAGASVTSNYHYDTFGRMLQTQNPDGTWKQYTYDYAYCDGHTVPGVQPPASQAACPVEQFSIQDLGPNGSSPVPLTPIKFVHYDALSREVYTDKLGLQNLWQRSSINYDANGHVASQSAPYFSTSGYPAAVYTSSTYDELGRALQTTHPDSAVDTPCASSSSATNIDTIVYNGVTTTTINRCGQVTTIHKDYDGNVDWSTDPQGNRLQFAYDGFDQRVQVTDPAGNLTSYVYDAAGRMISGVDPDKGSWSSSYDSLGELISTTTANNNTTTFTYDDVGRMLKRIEGGLTSSWVYDTAAYGTGKLASEKATGSGWFTRSGDTTAGYNKTESYDSFGRLANESVTQPSPFASMPTSWSEGYAYDASGRLVGHETPTDTICSSYSTIGYEKLESTGSGQGSSDSCTAVGTANQVATANDLWLQTAADPADHPTLIQYSAASATSAPIYQSITYNALSGRETSNCASAAALTLAPDLTSGSGFSSNCSTQSPLMNFTYSYDYMGNVTSRTTVLPGSSFTESFSYDTLNRLTVAQVAGQASVTVSYDTQGLGNIVAKSDAASGNLPGNYNYVATSGCAKTGGPHALNALTSSNGSLISCYKYDNDGNMTNGGGRTIAWTSFDMVKSAILSSVKVIYVYTPEHQRAQQLVAAQDTSVSSPATACPTGELLFNSNCYIPSLGTVYMAGYDAIGGTGTGVANCNNPSSNGYALRSYIFSPSGERVGELCHTGVGTGSASGPVAQYYLNDWQNSVSIVANAMGAVVSGGAQSYDAWGNQRSSNGVASSAYLSGVVPRNYTNQEQVAALQLINLNARMYDPKLGKMLSVDPAVANWLDPQAWNAYAYARNNPMAYTDPSGECWIFTSGCTFTKFLTDAGKDLKGVAHDLKLYQTQGEKVSEARNFFKNTQVTLDGKLVDQSKLSDEQTLSAFKQFNKQWEEIASNYPGVDPEAVLSAGGGKNTDDPSWSKARSDYWKSVAAEAEEGEYSPSNLARMKEGKPPLHDELGVPKELHHVVPQRDGGSHNRSNLREVWPWEHEAIDPYRHYNGPRPSGDD